MEEQKDVKDLYNLFLMTKGGLVKSRYVGELIGMPFSNLPFLILKVVGRPPEWHDLTTEKLSLIIELDASTQRVRRSLADKGFTV